MNDSAQTVLAFAIGLVMLAAYAALGVYIVRTCWRWSDGVQRRWVRVLPASLIAVFFFAPGVIGGGHGVGLGPAWLMLATGTFGMLTAASKAMFLVGFAVSWVIVFLIGMAITREKPG